MEPPRSTVEALLHSITEAAERLGLSRSTLYRLINGGDLATVKVRGRTCVTEAELQRFVASLTTDTNSAA